MYQLILNLLLVAEGLGFRVLLGADLLKRVSLRITDAIRKSVFGIIHVFQKIGRVLVSSAVAIFQKLAHLLSQFTQALTQACSDFFWLLRKIFLSKIALVAYLGLSLGVAVIVGFQSSLLTSLKAQWAAIPNPQTISDFQLPASTLIYDQKGILLYSTYTDSNRVPISLNSVPSFMVEATIAAEDQRFRQHPGIDPISLVRATLHNMTETEKQGGSTLTQQVARSVFLTRKKTLERKIIEAIIALRMERHLTKDQILELYFNTTPYGGNAIGVEAAAHQYFAKNASQLTNKEILFLVSITPAPTIYARDTQPDSPRIQYVLQQLLDNQVIFEEQYQQLLAEPLELTPQITYKRAPHTVDYVLSELVKTVGEDVMDRGLIVNTSIDLVAQNQFQQMVSEEVALHSKTYLFTNAAAIVVSPKDGRIISMIGSANYFDPAQGQVNVTTSQRQLGSAMKIVPYSYALENTYTPETVIADTPTVFKDYNNYTPRNYDRNFHGNVTLTQAFANSYNIPALKVTDDLGVDNIANFGVQMGISEYAQLGAKPPLSLAIGGVETSLLHLTQAYQIVANNGQKIPLSIIDNVLDHQNQVVYTRKVEPTQVISPKTSQEIFNILSDPKARQNAFGHPDYFSFPNTQVALKSGTSNDLKDNVTFSFTPDFVVGTWVGNNDNRSMHNVASGYSGASVIMHGITRYLLENSTTSISSAQSIAERK